MAQPKLSPMMQQYLSLKDKHKDCLLLFRLGDFYELFFEDAVTASHELDLTLTGRDCGLTERAPMCGVPYHAVDTYIAKLLAKGYKVAICEQLTDPSESRELVERDVVRIITPGTIIESSQLDEKSNNYLLSLFKTDHQIGLALVDVSTGEFSMSQVDVTQLLDELVRIQPTEIIANHEMHRYLEQMDYVKKLLKGPMRPYHEWSFGLDTAQGKLQDHFGTATLDAFECGQIPSAVCAAGALMEYLTETQKNALAHINAIKVYRPRDYMILDASARRNLELTETIRGKSRKGSLLWHMDATATSMGSRMLRKWMEQPLQNKGMIEARLNAVEELMGNLLRKQALSDLFKPVKDIERIVSKIAYSTINARDCVILQQSLRNVPSIKALLSDCTSSLLSIIGDTMDGLDDVYDLLSRAIADNPPLGVKDGGIIRIGYHEELDRLRNASQHGRELIAQMESAEREMTGIKNLRINYNRVFGYYIEVTQSNLDSVPYRYTRKQTLANAERYITQELKELEDTILGADDRSIKLEYQLFTDIRTMLSEQMKRLQTTSYSLSELDALIALASVALENNYIKPTIADSGEIRIVDGRHPVVERSLSGERFVPNHVSMDMTDDRFLIITGPNMSGKSTYLRQVAMITLMAHMGSYVPAHQATVTITDRIFTRIGATDDLFLGQSTFMVEMSELAQILHQATSRSLIILDEIGRGTSTYDGLSIAWAVVEYIARTDRVGAKTLFATHYHELTELEGLLPGVKNYCISIKEVGDQVLFLRRIVRGGADKSFGVHVAQLAGIPGEVLTRAKEILSELEQSDVVRKPPEYQMAMIPEPVSVPYQDMLHEIASMDMTVTTPIDAFYILNRLKERMKTC